MTNKKPVFWLIGAIAAGGLAIASDRYYVPYVFLGASAGIFIDERRGCIFTKNVNQFSSHHASFNHQAEPKPIPVQKITSTSPLPTPLTPGTPPPPPPRPQWVNPESQSRFNNMGTVVTYRKRSKAKPMTEAMKAKMRARELPDFSLLEQPSASPSSTQIEAVGDLLFKLDSYTYDRNLSERLVNRVAELNPGKTRRWCAEKALWDLERDRK